MSYTVDSSLDFLFPLQADLMPTYNENSNSWVIANATLFNTQWIDCSYPISSGYGRAPRYLYYFLVFFAVVGRRHTWIVSVALASVMTYSGAAAVHAIILAVIRTELVPEYMPENYEVVLAGGNTPNGSWVYPTPQTWRKVGLWLPVLPMVWDSDGDAVLAIVGVAFLVVTPMQTWSRTFKDSNGKGVLLLWSLLLLMGMICALVNEAYITFWTFPQFRFCPLHPLQVNDSLPLTNGGVYSIGGVWDERDRYRWNKTITSYFSNSTASIANNCIYPCFERTWRLRDPAEIVASARPHQINTDVAYWLDIAVYVVVCSSGLSSLTIFILKTSAKARRLRVKSLDDLRGRWRIAWGSRSTLSCNTAKKNITALLGSWVWLVDLYAKILSPIALVMFVVFAEWTVSFDQQGEDFRHVGQWGALIAAGLVVIAAVVRQWRECVRATEESIFAAADFVRLKVRKTQLGDIELSGNAQTTLGHVPDDNVAEANAGLPRSKTW